MHLITAGGGRPSKDRIFMELVSILDKLANRVDYWRWLPSEKRIFQELYLYSQYKLYKMNDDQE